jgi:DNA-binding transcriptional regulator YhcF (GntR family)
MELSIPLSKKNEPLFRQVYKCLRKAILSGAFRTGGRLPSTRDLAKQLGVSRTVALLAYEQLLAEGFAVGRGGSETYVFSGLGGAARDSLDKLKRVLAKMSDPPAEAAERL